MHVQPASLREKHRKRGIACPVSINLLLFNRNFPYLEVGDFVKKLVTDKQRVLLIYSEAAKRYVRFYELLKSGTQITDDNISTFDEETQTVSKFMVSKLVEEARNEWIREVKYKEYPKSAKMKCSICNTSIQYVFFITNSLTGEQLQVGRECVKQFVDATHLRLAERNHRAYIINREFPGIENTINDWNKAIVREIVVPSKIEMPYSHLGTRLRSIYNDFLDGSIDEASYEATYEAIRDILNSRQKILAEIDRYISSNRELEWVATRKMIDWLTNARDNNTINAIRHSGFISKEIAGLIAEDEFMAWVSKRVNGLLAGSGLVLQPVPNERAYTFFAEPLKGAQLKVPHSELFKELGDKIWNQTGIECREIIELSKPGNNSAYEIIMQAIAEKIKNTGLRYYDSNLEFDDAIFYDPLLNNYYKVAFRNFINKFTSTVYSKDSDPEPIREFLIGHGAPLNKESADYKINTWYGNI